MRSAHAAWLVALAVLVSGCGKDDENKNASTVAEKPAPTQPTTTIPAKPANPQKRAKKPPPSSDINPNYRPSGYHKHRARGVIYFDEGISEDVLTASRHRIVELFGPPDSRRGKCFRYREVGGPPHQGWEFCFKGQVMTGAGGINGYK